MSSTPLPAKKSYRSEPRRRFTRAYKRDLVQALLALPDSMARVARENDLNQNQLAKWRRDYQAGLLEDDAAARLLPVDVDVPRPIHVATNLVLARTNATSAGLELLMPKGRMLIHATPDAALLRELIEAMQ